MPGARNTGRSTLDDMRLRHGPLRMREYFYALALTEEEKALALLNESALQYPTLYILEPEIAKLELGGRLNDRSRLARMIAGEVAQNATVSPAGWPDLLPVLRWMHRTGWQADHLGEDYDGLMDTVAILLLHEYGDETSLPTVGDLLFARHRGGQYYYDLQWAYFGGPATQCLRQLEKRLRAPDGRDRELARKLLNVAPSFQAPLMHPDRQCRQAQRWIARNRPYLRYTGSTAQEGANIRRWELALGHKYLHHAPADDENLTGSEQEKLAAFATLAGEDRCRLGECSRLLRRRSIARWRRWMNQPLERQLGLARRIAKEDGYDTDW